MQIEELGQNLHEHRFEFFYNFYLLGMWQTQRPKHKYQGGKKRLGRAMELVPYQSHLRNKAQWRSLKHALLSWDNELKEFHIFM